MDSVMEREQGGGLEARIDRVLRDLHGSIHGLEASAVMTLDGMVIASRPAGAVDARRLDEAATAASDLGEGNLSGLELGELTQILIKTRTGYKVTVRVGEVALLSVEAGNETRPGLLLLKLRQAAQVIEGCL